MSKIARWVVGADDTTIVRKRVKFLPASTTDTVVVGSLVCYNWDVSSDVEERTTNPATAHFGSDGNETTYAEGAQAYTGRMLTVEKPATGNLAFFAGVVHSLGPLYGADGDTIEIAVPNGAVVPVRCNINCTAGTTVVTVANASYNGYYGGKPIGIAMETVDRSSTAGLVWVKLDPSMFLWQEINGGNVSPGAYNVTTNRIQITSAHTTGYATALLVKNEVSGILAASGGAAAVTGYIKVSGSITSTTAYVRSILGQLDLTGGTLNGSNIHACGVMAQVNGSAATTLTAVSKLACLMCDFSLPGSGPAAGDMSFIRCANNNGQNANVGYVFDIYGGYGIGNLFNLLGCSNTGEDTSYMVFAGGTGSGALSTGGAWKKIRVVIEGSTFYLVALPAPTSA